jgi:uncharacterized protein (DUF1499 family)
MKKTLLSLSLLTLAATSVMANDVNSQSRVDLGTFLAPTAAVACWVPGRGGSVEDCTLIHFLATTQLAATTVTVALLLKSEAVIAMVEKYEQTGEVSQALASLVKDIQFNLKNDHNVELVDSEVLEQLESQIF